MSALIRLHFDFPEREDEPLRFSDIVALVKAVADSTHALDPSVLKQIPAYVTRPRKVWREKARRVVQPLVDVQKELGASVSVGSPRGAMRRLVSPPLPEVESLGGGAVQGTTQVFGYLERSGGDQPSAQIRLPNGRLIYPKIQTIELSKRLAAHHYEDLFFTLAVRLNAVTGDEVSPPMITDFRTYRHVALHDVVLRGAFEGVAALHGSVDALLRDREVLPHER